MWGFGVLVFGIEGFWGFEGLGISGFKVSRVLGV